MSAYADVVYRDFRSGDVRHSLASIEKATSELGYEPQYNIKDGMKEALPWYHKRMLK